MSTLLRRGPTRRTAPRPARPRDVDVLTYLLHVLDTDTGPAPVTQPSSNFTTTAAFTPKAGCLLVAIGVVGNTGAGQVTGDISSSDASPTWQLVASSPATNSAGWVGIWVMDVTASTSSRTVSLGGSDGGTNATAVGVQITVKVLANCRAQSVAVGATNSIAGTTNYTIGVTTTQLGSLLIMGQVDNNTAGTLLVPTTTSTTWANAIDAGNTARYTAIRRTQVTTSLGVTSIGTDGISASNQSMAIAEILVGNPNDLNVDGDYAFNVMVVDDPTKALAVNDGVSPANGHQAEAPAFRLAAPDPTAPALTHQAFDTTVSTTSAVDVNAGATAADHQTGQPTAALAVPDVTAPALDHQTLAGVFGLGMPDLTAPALGHQAGQPTAGVAVPDVTAPALDHAAGALSSSLNVPDALAPAITHTAHDAVASTASAGSANAGETITTHQTGDPIFGLGMPDLGGPATTHQTQAPLAGPAAPDVTAPALGHQTGQPTTTITVPDPTAPAVGHQAETAAFRVGGTDQLAPALDHQTSNPAVTLQMSAGTAIATHQTHDPTITALVITTVTPDAGLITHQAFDATTAALGAPVNVTPDAGIISHTIQTTSVSIDPPGVQAAATAHQTHPVTSTQTSTPQAVSVNHSAYDCTFSTINPAVGRYSMDTGLAESARRDGLATRSTADQETFRSSQTLEPAAATASTADGTTTFGPLVG